MNKFIKWLDKLLHGKRFWKFEIRHGMLGIHKTEIRNGEVFSYLEVFVRLYKIPNNYGVTNTEQRVNIKMLNKFKKWIHKKLDGKSLNRFVISDGYLKIWKLAKTSESVPLWFTKSFRPPVWCLTPVLRLYNLPNTFTVVKSDFTGYLGNKPTAWDKWVKSERRALAIEAVKNLDYWKTIQIIGGVRHKK